MKSRNRNFSKSFPAESSAKGGRLRKKAAGKARVEKKIFETKLNVKYNR